MVSKLKEPGDIMEKHMGFESFRNPQLSVELFKLTNFDFIVKLELIRKASMDNFI